MKPFAVRLAVADDHPRVFSDWLRSARKSRTYSGVPNQVFYFWMHVTIEQLLADPKATWLVLTPPDDPTKILGWLCGQRADTLAGDQAVIHYVYVAKQYRRLGLATHLVDAFIGSATAIVGTSLTDAGAALLHDRLWVFNPFLLFAWTPLVVPAYRKNHPVRVSRRTLAAGGHDPEAAPE